MAGRFDAIPSPRPGSEVAERGAAGGHAHLVDAVREHEQIASRSTVPKRPADHSLYRRLAEIEDRRAIDETEDEMSPVWIIEGAAPPMDPVSDRDLAERKLTALADAVREHERDIAVDYHEARPQDRHLYHRLREICDEA
jgi:hypothetical protein